MKILVADDDRVSRRLLESTLASWGHEVVAARDGTEAWLILQQDDAPPLAILDWNMPGMDGVDVCRRVREARGRRYVYIIMVTAKAAKEDLIRALDAGADDYIAKPFHPKELEVRLRAGRRIVELQEALCVQATCDVLTGLWNRARIVEFLDREVARANREARPLAVFMVDLDHFKRVNDTKGHAAGDDVLREAARRMRVSLRPYDALGRYGGEEFLVVVPVGDPANARTVAERLRSCLAASPVDTAAGPERVTASLGVVAARGPGLEGTALVKLADEALYRAKRGGRNRLEMAALPDATQGPVTRGAAGGR